MVIKKLVSPVAREISSGSGPVENVAVDVIRVEVLPESLPTLVKTSVLLFGATERSPSCVSKTPTEDDDSEAFSAFASGDVEEAVSGKVPKLTVVVATVTRFLRTPSCRFSDDGDSISLFSSGTPFVSNTIIR